MPDYDKLTVTFTLRAATHADAIRSAGLAAGTLAELLAHHAAAVDLSASRSSFELGDRGAGEQAPGRQQSKSAATT